MQTSLFLFRAGSWITVSVQTVHVQAENTQLHSDVLFVLSFLMTALYL